MAETTTAFATSYASMTNLTANNSYPISRAYTNSSSTTYCQLNVSKSKTGSIYLTGFDLSSIPSNAIINSVTVKVRCMISSTNYITAATVQASSGATLKGSSASYRSTTNSVYTLSGGSWTRAELDDFRVYFTAKKSNTNSTAYMRIYGMDVSVSWELPSEPEHGTLFVQVGGKTRQVQSIYRKVGGYWIEVQPDELDLSQNFTLAQ